MYININVSIYPSIHLNFDNFRDNKAAARQAQLGSK